MVAVKSILLSKALDKVDDFSIDEGSLREMGEQDDSLVRIRRYLFDLPAKSSYKIDGEVRRDIRRALFMTISRDGKYLDWFFPRAFSDREVDDDDVVLDEDVVDGKVGYGKFGDEKVVEKTVAKQKEARKEQLIRKLEEKFEWQYINYYKSGSCLKDCEHSTQSHQVFHMNLPCSRIFRKGEPIYRCLTCGFDETCALCSLCYEPEYHKNHKVHITICQRENGGVCDCGDPEAWVKSYVCPYTLKYNTKSRLQEKEMPRDLQHSFIGTIEILLDHVIDVMSTCYNQFCSEEDHEKLSLQQETYKCNLDPLKYGWNASRVDQPGDKFFLMLYNDQMRHYRDAVQRIHLASRKVTQFATMITEKVQSYGKAKVICSSDVALLKERQKILGATGLATSIRNQRDVFREEVCDEILLWINSLTESELFKTSNTCKDLFCRAFCKRWNEGLAYTSNMTSSNYKVGTLDAVHNIPKIHAKAAFAENKSSSDDWNFLLSKWNLSNELCNECQYDLTDEDYQPHRSHLGSRFQYLTYLDIRFWKSIRILLHDMYSTSIITNLTYKNIISCQYVDIYPMVVDMFLTLDREPELNVMCTLSTQLFTSPSNATSIIQHGDLSRIFSAIFGFLTAEEIQTPGQINLSRGISIQSLKNRRWSQIFFDIGYILSRSEDSMTILTGNILPMACDVLGLFQGRPVLKRESKNHVEYENTDYTAFFHAILVIYQFAEHIAHSLDSLKQITHEQRITYAESAIKKVVGYLLKLELKYASSTESSIDISSNSGMRAVVEPITNTHMQDFRIDFENVSFLHPLHSFLSWLIDLADLESIDSLRDIIAVAISDTIPPTDQYLLPNPMIALFDYPIRTIILMSQIKSGFWVRNGFSVRSQLQLYRNTGLRECGYLRDLYLTQIFMSIVHPDISCYLIFQRWLMLDGFVIDYDDQSPLYASKEEYEEYNALVYDAKTLPYMIEEILNFFIQLITEDVHLRKHKEETVRDIRIKNEIIHNLCFGPMNYTKLCSQIPDHITSEKRFDLILEDLTTFTAPNGCKDIGTYQLKDIYFDEVNPYYFNYTSNTKDDAINFVKNRIHKKTGLPLSNIVFSPKVRQPEELGIFRNVGNFAVSFYFRKFLIKVFKYISSQEVDKVDILLETALHLVHICAFEDAIDIKGYGTFLNKFVDTEGSGDSIASSLYDIISEGKFEDQHGKIRSIFGVFHEKYQNFYDILANKVENFDPNKLEFNDAKSTQGNDAERKKLLAKERQCKLLAKFKKQQSLFIKNHKFEALECSDVDMEEPEEEEGWKFPEPHCILCQNASEDGGPFGIITYISKSSEFRNIPFKDRFWFLKAFSDSENLDTVGSDKGSYTSGWKEFMNTIKSSNVIGPGFSDHTCVESKLVSLSCGHGMHFQCYVNYLNSNRNRQNHITRNSPENVEHKEFLCPLCKAINNMFIPILWSANNRNLESFIAPTVMEKNSDPIGPLDKSLFHDQEWLNKFVEETTKDIQQNAILTPFAKDMIQQSSLFSNSNQQHFRVLLSNMFQILSLLTFPQIYKADSSNVLTNTIKSVEISLRGGKSIGNFLLEQITNNSLINLRTLNEFRNTSLYIKSVSFTGFGGLKPDIHVKILANLLNLSTTKFNRNVMELDFFEVLVNLFPLPSTGFSFNSILRVTFLGQVLQSIYVLTSQFLEEEFYEGIGFSFMDIPIIKDIPEEAAFNAKGVFSKVLYALGGKANKTLIDYTEFGHTCYSMLIKAITPFLRRTAIFAYINCAKVNCLNESKRSLSDPEADRLCLMLKIDTVKELLSFMNFEASERFETTRFNSFVYYLSDKTNYSDVKLEKRKTLEYPGIISLIDLPTRLDNFFTKYYYLDRYNYPYMSIEDPAVCLFCAKVVDAQKSALGCEVGQCTTHYTKECSNNVGIFLLPKDRCFLLLYKNGGSFYSAPYLDQHGELPGDAKRGKTLHLMEPRYADFIRNVWLQHNVPNYIVRKLDSVIDAGGWDTL